MDPSKAYQNGYIQGDDGTKLFWQRWSSPRPVKRTIVIVHDLKDHGARYEDLAVNCLVPEGYGVYALDLRGHGQSRGDRGYVDEFDRYQRDLDAFARHVRKDEWSSLPCILGHGVGGTLAALYATSQDRPVRGIAISGAWLQGNISELVMQGLRMADTPSREPAKAKFFGLNVDDYSHHRSVVDALRKDPLIQDEMLPARTALQVHEAMGRVRSMAKKLTVPLLVLHGEADRVAPIAGAKAFYEAAGSESKVLRCYAECAHALWHEPEPNQTRIRGDLLAWLNETA